MKHPKPASKGASKKGRWREGPLPANTYGWGGIVTKECPKGIFLYADFCGDYAMIYDSEKGHLITRRVEACDILLWDNPLTEPPTDLLEEVLQRAGDEPIGECGVPSGEGLGICRKPKGHEGHHQWTPTDEQGSEDGSCSVG